MKLSRLPALLALLAVLLVATACGTASGTEETGVASLESDGEAALGDAASAASLDDGEDGVDAEQAALDFSACMRDEGLDFPDVGVDADGRINLRTGFERIDPQGDEFRSAMAVCQPLLESAGFGAGNRAAVGENVEIQDALVEFSACVRAAGYDVGDVTLGGPGANNQDGEGDVGPEARGQGERQGGFGDRSSLFASQLGLDPEDPDVAATIDSCMPIIDEAFAAAGVGGR